MRWVFVRRRGSDGQLRANRRTLHPGSRVRGKVLPAIRERLAEGREPDGPKRRNCGFLGLESAYSPNEP